MNRAQQQTELYEAIVRAKELLELMKRIQIAEEEHEKLVMINDVMEIQTVDAEPVRHGKWMSRTNELKHPSWFSCSECGGQFDYKWKFCPNCGAKMDREGKYE